MTKIPPPRFEGTFRLDDGRRLGYAEYGPADGKPLLGFHGTPGGRRQMQATLVGLARPRKSLTICCRIGPG